MTVQELIDILNAIDLTAEIYTINNETNTYELVVQVVYNSKKKTVKLET